MENQHRPPVRASAVPWSAVTIVVERRVFEKLTLFTQSQRLLLFLPPLFCDTCVKPSMHHTRLLRLKNLLVALRLSGSRGNKKRGKFPRENKAI